VISGARDNIPTMFNENQHIEQNLASPHSKMLKFPCLFPTLIFFAGRLHHHQVHFLAFSDKNVKGHHQIEQSDSCFRVPWQKAIFNSFFRRGSSDIQAQLC
jgi:hypothetical protein